MIDQDGLEVMAIREWALEKHEYLTKYIDACRQVRKRFANSTCDFVDLFCGPGRVVVEGEDEVRDGGTLGAFRIAAQKENPFSSVLISDANASYVAACKARLQGIGATVEARVGAADDVAAKVSSSLRHYGFHVVYLDPYNSSALPFTIFKEFFHLKHVDFIVHFSNNHVQRNLEQAIISHDTALHRFAPGWEKHVDLSSKANMRVNFMRYWISLFEKHDFKAATSMPLMTNTTHAPLYSLVLISRNDTALRMWNSVTNKPRQGSLL